MAIIRKELLKEAEKLKKENRSLQRQLREARRSMDAIQHKNQEELKRRAWQLEQKNKELENAHKELASFTYVSSHDLQEPLRKIQNFITCILLEEEKKLSESGKGYFQRMRQATKRMQALIEDLLAYSRIWNNGQTLERTNMKVVVDEVKTDLEKVIQEKNATIEVKIPDKIDMIRHQFYLVMHNLISNSLKFSNPTRPPHILMKSEIVRRRELNHEALASEIDYCHIAYSDNGIGFDPQYNERIFQVFQRLHGQEKYKGTGMGLAICKRIIENHHGIIQASGKVNAGARFDIYIPVLPDKP